MAVCASAGGEKLKKSSNGMNLIANVQKRYKQCNINLPPFHLPNVT